jgi:hypothetical protein
MSYDLVTGDTGSKLVVTITDSDTGAAVDLTSCTVRFRWADAAGAIVNRTATILNPANGKAEYQFAAGEIIAPEMQIEVEVTDGTGAVVTGTELIKLTVREELG